MECPLSLKTCIGRRELLPLFPEVIILAAENVAGQRNFSRPLATEIGTDELVGSLLFDDVKVFEAFLLDDLPEGPHQLLSVVAGESKALGKMISTEKKRLRDSRHIQRMRQALQMSV